MGLKANDLFMLIRDYFKNYLPAIRKSSPNTIRTYQVALEQLLDYIKENRSISLYYITLDMIDRNTVTSYLVYLDTVKGCSITTRNHRLNCIRCFLKYAASCNIGAAVQWNEIQSIKRVRGETKPVEHLRIEAVEAILAQPNTSTQKGLRDMFLMLFLYQTGARVQEMVDVRIKDISFGDVAVATLRGKGSKVRCIPLREMLMAHLGKYMSVFHPGTDPYSDDYLFYTTHNRKRGRMCEDNVRRLVQKYGQMAREKLPQIPENVHPHLFRHSRAMHLYQNGVALPLVSQWLGHSRLDTTLIYAHADTEQKRKAIEKAIPEESTLKQFLNSDRYTLDDEETIKQLYGLR
jgi:site-specific recombinase XerD